MRKRYAILCGTATAVFLLDQLSKWLVVQSIPMHGSLAVIDGFFNLVNIRNRGAAFGFLNRSDIEWQFWLFLAATIMAVTIIFALVRKTEQAHPWLLAGLGMVMGGALGNLLDRLRFRAVIDFLDFYWKEWHWPAFNVADSAILLGALLSCLLFRNNLASDCQQTDCPADKGGNAS